MPNWLKKLFARPDRIQPEARYIVTVNDQRVICQDPDGGRQMVTWDDLETVIIETNDLGPLSTGFFWILLARRGTHGCVVPIGATGEAELVKALQALPGFDNDQLGAAVKSTQNASFVCWRRPRSN